jgi:hypothetical protein
MLSRCCTVVCLTITVMLPATPARAWLALGTLKPVEELQLMTERELAFEGANACRTQLVWFRGNLPLAAIQMAQYGERIALVARTKWHSTTPEWVGRMNQAITQALTSKDYDAGLQACLDIALDVQEPSWFTRLIAWFWH